MSEEKRKYVLAQLNSLPNAFQYVEVRSYIESLQQENQSLKEKLDIEYHELASEIARLQQENQQLKERISKIDKHVSSLSSKGRGCEIYADVKSDILNVVRGVKNE